MLEAMRYRVRIGRPLRDLPPHFGPWSSAYTRWRRWNLSGVWAHVLDLLAQKADGALRLLDATHIKDHDDASNPEGGQAEQAIGRTKGGINTKNSALVEPHSRTVQLTLSPGQWADVKAAEKI